MTSAPRRSRRAVPVKTSNFNVGDIVEVSRELLVPLKRLVDPVRVIARQTDEK